MDRLGHESNEYISLRDILLKIGEYLREIRSKYFWMILLGLLVGAYMSYSAYVSPKIYREKLTFMMDEKSGESVEGLNLLSGLFGSKKKDNLGRILQLFESKKIIHNTLFDTITIEGKNDFLANHFLDQYSIETLVKGYTSFGFLYKQSWPKRLLKNPDFRFSNANVDKFNVNENLYLRLLYEKVNGSSSGLPQILTSSMDQETGIMTLQMESEREMITLGILNNIYIQLSKFFIEKSVEKQMKTYNIIKFKKDSILSELKVSEYSLADFKDSNRNLVTVKGYLKQLRLERQVSIMNVMYAEAVKQMEATDFALRNKTPVVQVIDYPRRPIIPSKPSFVSNFIKGFIFGAFVVAILVTFRKLIRGIIYED